MKSLNAEIPTAKSLTIKKVLAAVGLSAHSEATATYAAKIAKGFNASLTLVYVYEPIPPFGYGSATYTPIEGEREDLRKLLDQLTQKVRKVSGVCDAVILVGSPAEQISVLARDIDADLIVTASHHPTLHARLLNLDEAPHIMHRLLVLFWFVTREIPNKSLGYYALPHSGDNGLESSSG